MKTAIITLLALVAVNAHALNGKYDDGRGNLITEHDDPGCRAQITIQGQAGNVRTICTRRAPVDPPATIPATCENGGHPLQVLQGILDWNVGAGIATYSASMRGGQAYIYVMRTGAASSLATLVIAEYGGAAPYRTMVISRTPCDFDALNPTNAWGVGTTAEANFSVGMPNQFNYPVLLPDTTYYINIRNATWQDPATDTCPAGADCKFVMSLRHQ